MGRESGIATVRGSNPMGEGFSARPDQSRSSVSCTMKTIHLHGNKRPGGGVDHPRNLAQRLKKEQSFNSISLLGIHSTKHDVKEYQLVISSESRAWTQHLCTTDLDWLTDWLTDWLRVTTRATSATCVVRKRYLCTRHSAQTNCVTMTARTAHICRCEKVCLSTHNSKSECMKSHDAVALVFDNTQTVNLQVFTHKRFCPTGGFRQTQKVVIKQAII
jgi:hypothetical protein